MSKKPHWTDMLEALVAGTRGETQAAGLDISDFDSSLEALEETARRFDEAARLYGDAALLLEKMKEFTVDLQGETIRAETLSFTRECIARVRARQEFWLAQARKLNEAE